MKETMEDYPFKGYDRVIVRDKDLQWRPALYSKYKEAENYPFKVWPEEVGYKLIAPFEGNEKCIGTQDEAYETWDRERLENALKKKEPYEVIKEFIEYFVTQEYTIKDIDELLEKSKSWRNE